MPWATPPPAPPPPTQTQKFTLKIFKYGVFSKKMPIFLRSGVDFTDETLVYKDANQQKSHKIILSRPDAYWWRTAKILTSDVCVEDQ